jgi:thioredoxin reductase
MFDVVIVGGGVAGLSAALVLGRARRRVLVLDGGMPRNAPAEAAHGVFTRDGTPPHELLAIGREQLLPYESVELQPLQAKEISQVPGGFRIECSDGVEVQARKVLLATGVVDELPEIPGFRELWGSRVFQCPYCHGWEVRDEPLGVYARGEAAMHMAPLIHNWSRNIVLLSDGPDQLDDQQRATLTRLGIELQDASVVALEETDDGRVRVRLASGDALLLSGIFAVAAQRPRNELARRLGCELVEEGFVPGAIKVDPTGQTTVPGVYAAGDVTGQAAQLTLASASAVNAAAQINFSLVKEEIAAVAAV